MIDKPSTDNGYHRTNLKRLQKCQMLEKRDPGIINLMIDN